MRPKRRSQDGPDVDRLYREQSAWLEARLRRRAPPQAVADLAQQVWLRVSGRPGLVGEVRRPRAWLARVADNLLADRFRREGRRPREIALDLEEIEAGAAADQFDRLALKQTILSLPPALRDVLLLNRVLGWTFEHFESGRGRFDFGKVRRFAEVLDADPFAILMAVLIGSPGFAARAADNKMAMILLLELEEFDRDHGDRLLRLDPARVLAEFGEAYRRLGRGLTTPNGTGGLSPAPE